MPRLTYSLRPCSKGSSMLRPTDRPRPSRAPRLAASMVPGPPPVITAKPRRASSAARARAASYIGAGGRTRADPKKVTAGPTVASASKPATNSAWIRSTRQGSLSRNSGAPSGRSSSLRSSIWRSTPRRPIPPVRRSLDSSPIASLTLTAPPLRTPQWPGLLTRNQVEARAGSQVIVLRAEHSVQCEAARAQPPLDLIRPDQGNLRMLNVLPAAAYCVIDFDLRHIAIERFHPNVMAGSRLQPVRIGQLGGKQTAWGHMGGCPSQAPDCVEDVGRNHHKRKLASEVQVLDSRMDELGFWQAPACPAQHSRVTVDADQLDPGRAQRHRQPPGSDAEVEHGRGGRLRELQPGRQVGGVRKLRVELREPFVGDRRVVANDAHARVRAWSSGDGLVRDSERLVDDGESLRQLFLVDAQWWVRHDRVPADEGVEALLTQGLPHRLHRLRGSIEGSERLHRLPVFDQLQDAEETNRARGG